MTNGGSAVSGENWSQALQRELANRYFTSVMCSWYKPSFFLFLFSLCKSLTVFVFVFSKNRQATGGSIPNVLPRLTNPELNVTQSINNTGNVSGILTLHFCVCVCANLFLQRCLRNFPIWTLILLVKEESIQFKYVFFFTIFFFFF